MEEVGNVLSDDAQKDASLVGIYEANIALLKVINAVSNEEVKELVMDVFWVSKSVAAAIARELNEKRDAMIRVSELENACSSLQNKQVELYALMSLQTAEINRLTNQESATN